MKTADLPPNWNEEIESGSLVHRWRNGCRKTAARPDWVELLGPDWADRIMDLDAPDRFHAKQGRSIGRLTLKGSDRRLVVYLKRHYVLPRRHGWLATLFPAGAWSPGWQELGNLRQARALGLPVPEVAAAGEFVGPHGRLQSFLAVEELADMLPLHEAIPLAKNCLDGKRFARWKAGLAAEMARLTRLLHDAAWFHKDLYLCHFYVRRGDILVPPLSWPGRLMMIDFHRMARHAWTWSYWRMKDLGQLLYSSDVDGVTPRDRLRFWKLYLGRPRRQARWWTWLVNLRGGLYRRHNRKRKAAAGAVKAA